SLGHRRSPSSSRFAGPRRRRLAGQRGVDLLLERLVREVLQLDRARRALRIAESVALAQNGVHARLLAERPEHALDRAVRAGADTRPARDESRLRNLAD